MGNDGSVSIGGVAAELGLSPSRIRQLTEIGVLTAQRTAGGHRRYDLAEAREAWLRYRLERAGVNAYEGISLPSVRQAEVSSDQTFPLNGLAEDQVWHQLQPGLGLPEGGAAKQIVAYAFTEMLNNAIDHSGGEAVRIRTTVGEGAVVITVQDDGSGVFAHLAEGLGPMPRSLS